MLALVLRGGQDPVLHLLVDVDLPPQEIDAGHGQPQRFTFTQARPGRQPHSHLVSGGDGDGKITDQL